MTILVWGNPFDGLSVVGPFDSTEEAARYAETDREIRGGDWWAIDVDGPAENWQGEESS